MTERFAKEAGVDIVSYFDLVIQGAVAKGAGRYGYLDSLQVGGMTL